MRVYVVEEARGEFVALDVPRPSPRLGEVLVRIQASGVNPLDIKIRACEADHAKHPLPAVLGLDMAGVVEEVGLGVTTFAVRDEVMAWWAASAACRELLLNL